MARFVIGSSLKMYFSHARTLEWVRGVAGICANHPVTGAGTVEFFVIPTFPSIPAVVEVGPAGRRAMFGETDEIGARKTLAGLRNGLAPVLCIGEKDHGAPAEAAEFCIRQLESALAPAREAGAGGPLIGPYEPIWAIGAPEPAPAEYVSAVCRALREHVRGDALF